MSGNIQFGIRPFEGGPVRVMCRECGEIAGSGTYYMIAMLSVKVDDENMTVALVGRQFNCKCPRGCEVATVFNGATEATKAREKMESMVIDRRDIQDFIFICA